MRFITRLDRPDGIPVTIWNMPAMAPPPGKISNFEHPENKDAEIIVMNSVFLALLLIAVSVRFINDKPNERRISWDKGLCIVAAMGSICHSAIMLSSLSIGYGKHLWEIRAITITRENLLRMNQLSTLYIVTVGFGKLSVLTLYHRFFEVMPTSRMLIWFGIAFTIVSSLVFLGIEIFQATQCVRLDSFSSPSFCTEMPLIVVVQAAINVFLDFYIVVIPLQQVLKLNIRIRKKLGVLALFGIGFSACVVSAVRLAFTILHIHETDQFWSAILTSELSIVEMNVVIIAPCLLFTPAFVRMSRSSLYSLRSKLLSRSRIVDSHENSLSDKPKHDIGVEMKVHAQVQENMELDFITKPDSHLAHSKLSVGQVASAQKHESDGYHPI